VAQNVTQGAVQSSTRPLDVAITNGDGFFRLASPGGEISYSRNGQFNMDKDGFLVNAAGLKLTGFPVGANGAVAGGSPAALQFPTTGMAPKPTDAIAAQFNLDSRSVVPTKPFDAKDSASYNYSNAVTIFDSLGNSHELATFFRNVSTPATPTTAASNSWEVYATADGKPLDKSGKIAVAVSPAAAVAEPLEYKTFTAGANGKTLDFTTDGVLISPSNNLPPPNTKTMPVKLEFAALNFGNGSSDLNYTIDVTGTTQFGNDNQVTKLTQTGYTSGVLTSYAIAQDGIVTGKYSNEQSNPLGQIVLSSFLNPNGLQPMGDNVWAETSASGQALTGTPGTGTKQGALTSGALESSNVDLTSELVNLIIAQRTYQANSQTVKTQDQVMQTLINLR
jgi:flagellar hook protein FlgE